MLCVYTLYTHGAILSVYVHLYQLRQLSKARTLKWFLSCKKLAITKHQGTAQCVTEVPSWIRQTSTKLLFMNDPVELSAEVQKYLVTDLDKGFGCPITAAH